MNRSAALICLTTLFASTTVLAQDGTRPQVNEEGLPILTDICTQLSELRGLDFLKDVPSKRQSPEDWAASIKAEIDKTMPADKQVDIVDGLLKLGMLTERIEFGDAFVDALQSQAAAYYDPMNGTFFYLMDDMPLPALRGVASHELVHALQDQHYDLKSRMEVLEALALGEVRNDDAVLAFRYLVEGEATYVQTLWQMQHQMGMDTTTEFGREMVKTAITMQAAMSLEDLIQMTEAAAQGGQLEGMEDAAASMEEIPKYILEPLLAAYMDGAELTMALHQDGGWDNVATAWDSPPRSSEQAMHPEKLKGEIDEPTELNIPEFECLKETSWKRIDAAIHGELYLRMLLRNYKYKMKKCNIATAGWDGDVYAAWRNDAGEVMMMLATTWDTEEDAKQFDDAWRAILPKRYDKLAKQMMAPGGPRLGYACGPNLGSGSIERRGTEVFVVEGADMKTCRAMVEELKAMPIARR